MPIDEDKNLDGNGNPRQLCRGPDCSRFAHAKGLCETHYRQMHRGEPLSIINPKSKTAKAYVGLRVTPETAAKVKADYKGAVQALETWARRRR